MQNNPLYLEVFQSKGKQEDALKFHYIVHCALDAVEEKGAVCYAPNLSCPCSLLKYSWCLQLLLLAKPQAKYLTLTLACCIQLKTSRCMATSAIHASSLCWLWMRCCRRRMRCGWCVWIYHVLKQTAAVLPGCPDLPKILKVVPQNERQLTVLTLICRCSKDFTQPM